MSTTITLSARQRHAILNDTSVTRLHDLYQERDLLSARLTEVNEEIGEIEEKFKSLSRGTHIYGAYVVAVLEKAIKGRKSTSWKIVAENVHSYIEVVRDKLLIKYVEAAPAINAFAKNMDKRYNEFVNENTKSAEDKTETVVEFTKAATVSK